MGLYKLPDAVYQDASRHCNMQVQLRLFVLCLKNQPQTQLVGGMLNDHMLLGALCLGNTASSNISSNSPMSEQPPAKRVRRAPDPLSKAKMATRWPSQLSRTLFRTYVPLHHDCPVFAPPNLFAGRDSNSWEMRTTSLPSKPTLKHQAP